MRWWLAALGAGLAVAGPARAGTSPGDTARAGTSPGGLAAVLAATGPVLVVSADADPCFGRRQAVPAVAGSAAGPVAEGRAAGAITMKQAGSVITDGTLRPEGWHAAANASLPEFVLGQWPHVLQAMGHAGPVLLFEGEAAGTHVARFAVPAGVVRLVASAPGPDVRARFAVRVAWKGQYSLACAAGFAYRHEVTERWRAENAALASLTGWTPQAIRAAMVAQWQAMREVAQ